MRDPAIEGAFRAFARERRYSSVTIDRWLSLGSSDGAAVCALVQELRLGENQLRDLWEWADEIAARDGLSLAQVLAADTVMAARRRPMGRNDKLKQVKSALRSLRFPQLAAVEDRLHALVRELGLPDTVRVIMPEFLEGDGIRVEIVATSTAALREAATRLLAVAQAPACDAIFELLEEAP